MTRADETFSSPLTDDPSAWSAATQIAAQNVRREVQRLYRAACEASRAAAHLAKRDARRAEIEVARYPSGTPACTLDHVREKRTRPEADHVQDYKALFAAYHAWSGTMSPRPVFTAEMPELLYCAHEVAGRAA